MGLFGRGKPLHERLLEQGGMEPREPEARPYTGAIDETGIHGIARRREWDAVVTAVAPEVRGDEVAFVALPDGALLVESEDGESSLDPLADAVEAQIGRPYRAQGVRKHGDLWAVSARTIRIAELDADGEELQLTAHGDEKTLLVDGERGFGSVPGLEQLGEARASSYVARASRLDGNLWEVDVAPL